MKTTADEQGSEPGERPWVRVKTPNKVPCPVDDVVLNDLGDTEFAALLRDQLVPRQPQGPERDRWEQLWALLVENDSLADRAYDVLEEFLEAIEHAKGNSGLEARERERVEKYERFVHDAWNRLETVDRPLGWAGRGAMAFNSPARKVIDQLVTAIADHRRTVRSSRPADNADEHLWAVLRRIRLDPGT
jgi:hypothetical protein